MRRRDRPAAGLSDEVILGVLQQLQSLDQRLGRVEQLLAETEVDRLAQAEQRDLIDVRLHSARLAAELSRVTVDLQARIDAVAAGAPTRDRTDQPTIEIDHLPAPRPTESSPAWEPIDDD